MSAVTPTPLGERVRSVIRCDDYEPAGVTLPEGEDFTTREYDLIEWASAYGIAFGLARMEDPCESLHSVADRARGAAIYAIGVHEPKILERVCLRAGGDA